MGIVGFPILEVSLTPPDEGQSETQYFAMQLADGDRTAGVWMIELPLEGRPLYYRYLAEDGIPGQPCPHILEEPAEGFIEVVP